MLRFLNHFKLRSAIDGACVGVLAAMTFGPWSWQFLAVLIAWAVFSAFAEAVDSVRGVNT